jgi:hypothetical protein
MKFGKLILVAIIFMIFASNNAFGSPLFSVLGECDCTYKDIPEGTETLFWGQNPEDLQICNAVISPLCESYCYEKWFPRKFKWTYGYDLPVDKESRKTVSEGLKFKAYCTGQADPDKKRAKDFEWVAVDPDNIKIAYNVYSELLPGRAINIWDAPESNYPELPQISPSLYDAIPRPGSVKAINNDGETVTVVIPYSPRELKALYDLRPDARWSQKTPTSVIFVLEAGTEIVLATVLWEYATARWTVKIAMQSERIVKWASVAASAASYFIMEKKETKFSQDGYDCTQKDDSIYCLEKKN